MSYAGKSRRTDALPQGEGMRGSAVPGKRTLTMDLPPAAAPGVPQRGGVAEPWMHAAMQPEQSASSASSGQPGQSLRSGGAPLPDDVRMAMGRSFGADFSAVRVHQDGEAEAMGAQAFARGADVHFAPGRYDPYGAAGKELLAHELAHLVQQADGRAGAEGQGKDAAIVDDPALESEADAMAARAVRGERAGGSTPRVIAAGSGRAAQRRIDRSPDDYFERVAIKDGGSEEKMLAHVRRYVFEEPVNGKQQTFQAVVTEVVQRAPRYREGVQQDWQSFLQQLRIGDAERCQDLLWTLAGFINQIYAVPGRLLETSDSQMSHRERGDLSRIRTMPHDYLERGPKKKPLDAMAQVRAYAFSEVLNRRGQTLQEIAYETASRAPVYGKSIREEWQRFLGALAREDAEACGDALYTLATFIDQIQAVPQRMEPLTMSNDQSAMAQWGAELDRRHGTTATHVESIDPARDLYTVYTVDISRKVPSDGAFVVQDDEIAREEQRNHVLFRDMTKSRFDFIFVILPRVASAEVLQTRVRFRGKEYRLDLMGGSFAKNGSALGVETSGAEVFSKLLGYEESAVYALRALFPQVVGGVKGTVRGRSYPVDPKQDPTGEALTFTLRDGKTKVQLNDGWGYIKSTLAGKMQEHELTRDKRQPEPQSANANYQMTHWFNTVYSEVIHELVGHGLSQWQALTREAEQLEKQLKSAPKDERFEIEKALRENVEKRYSVLTTGRPPMESAVAMPVSGEKLVLPSGAKRFEDAPGGGVSLLRSPADKPNWRPIEAEDVEHDSDRSKFLAGMEAIQYTWTGQQDGLLTFFKGMLGVISDDNWPDAWKGVDVVVTGEDRKLYEQWHSEKDRKETRGQAQDFTIQGNLVATQWFEKGSVVGVPNSAMKWLGGDYDGDEVNLLLETRNPQVTAQIREEYQEEQINPKLPKSFTDNPGGSRAHRLVAMQSKNVSLWSNIAARLRAMTPQVRSGLAVKLRQGNILPLDELGALEPEDAMWLEVGKGIKVGTDGYKTSVPVEKYEMRASEYHVALNNVNLYPLPYEKSLMKTIEKAGPPTLKNGAWRDIYFSCANPFDTGHAAPLWGVPAATLERMLYWLFPQDEQFNVRYYHELWLREMRGHSG